MLLSRLCALALVSGLVACAHSEQRTTPAFESRMPPLQSAFGELDAKGSSADACADLSAAALLVYEETPDGAAITLTPRAGHAAADVENAAIRVEEAFLPGVSDEERASCRFLDGLATTRLAADGRGDDVSVRVSNGVSGMRLVFDTFDPKKVADVRAKVKAFVVERTP